MRFLTLLLALLLALPGCGLAPVEPAPPTAPPTEPGTPPPWEPPAPPPVPPPTPPPTPPPVGDLPAVGTPKADVVAAWGAGVDLPENPGEDDAVVYVRTIDGREAEVHVIYRGGVVLRVVVSFLVGGGVVRLESVQALIEEVTQTTEVVPGIRVYADGRTLPVALGTGRTGSGPESFRLAIFASDPVAAAALRVKANDEADVYLIDAVTPRVTSTWAKQPHERIGIGRQIGPVGQPWVGTGGEIVRSAENPDVLLQITNRHVIGLDAVRGRVMHQGGRTYGVVWAGSTISFSASNPFDSGSVAVDRARKINPTYEQGLDDNLAGFRRMTPEDIGRRFTNTGQTRGTMFGSCIAVGIRDLAVGYDEGTARFHGQCAFVGEDGKPFSVGGHSGSLIACMADRFGTAKLFAGGPDGQGRDVTFANEDLPGAIAAAGGVPQLIAA